MSARPPRTAGEVAFLKGLYVYKSATIKLAGDKERAEDALLAGIRALIAEVARHE